MGKIRNTLSVLSVLATLLAGCESAPSPRTGESASGASGTAERAPGATNANPALTIPSEAPQANIQPNAIAPESAAAVSMSIAEVQRRLTQLGYHPGPVDGIEGPRTINALRQFQHDHNLSVTGTVEGETIRELRKP